MTIEKMLAFANDMKKIYIEKISAEGADTKDEKYLAIMFPEFEKILNTISELQTEIAFAEAKKMGRGSEKTRTTAAKKFLKTVPKGREESLGGYKVDEESGSIVFCNGSILYIGSKIIGIPEVSKPEHFLNYKPLVDKWENYLRRHENDGIDLDVGSVKANFKIAKAETKGRENIYGKLYKEEDLRHISDKASVCFDLADEKKVYFNAYYIILAADMIGGSDFTIYLGENNYSPCKIVGEGGVAYVMPFYKTEI